MPVGRVSSRRELTAVALAVGGILLSVLALVGLLSLARDGDVKVRLGSDTFNAGRADHMAERIASDGPLLLPDLSGGSRDLYVNHVGAAPDVGWVAFAARPEGSRRDCFVEWKPDSHIRMVRFDDYKPRAEAPNGWGGRKIAYLDEGKGVTWQPSMNLKARKPGETDFEKAEKFEAKAAKAWRLTCSR